MGILIIRQWLFIKYWFSKEFSLKVINSIGDLNFGNVTLALDDDYYHAHKTDMEVKLT